MVNGFLFVIDMIYLECFKYVEELKCMGVNIEVDEGIVMIKLLILYGVEVYVSDLRVGVCLIIVGLIVEGVIIIYNVKYIYRGYIDIVEYLKVLGVDIWMEIV